MTYRISAPRFVGVIFLISAAATAGLKVDSLAVAMRCCPREAAGCCAETIDKLRPLNCSLPFEDLISATNCIQAVIYGRKSMNVVRIEDVECCQVFSDDFSDDSETCLSTCTQTLRLPSMRSFDKLNLIKKCRSNNKNYNCFRRCQSFLRSRSTPKEKFPYLAVCDLASRLESGVLYIGPELQD